MEPVQKPVIFVGNFSDSLKSLHDTLMGESESGSLHAEIYHFEQIDELPQTIPTLGSSLIVTSDIRICATLLLQNKKLIKALSCKVIIINPKVLPSKILDKFHKSGLTDYIKEPIAPKTLLYKVKLLVKSLPVARDDKEFNNKISKEKKLQEQEEQNQSFSKEKKEIEERKKVNREEQYHKSGHWEAENQTSKLNSKMQGESKSEHLQHEELSGENKYSEADLGGHYEGEDVAEGDLAGKETRKSDFVESFGENLSNEVDATNLNSKDIHKTKLQDEQELQVEEEIEIEYVEEEEEASARQSLKRKAESSLDGEGKTQHINTSPLKNKKIDEDEELIEEELEEVVLLYEEEKNDSKKSKGTDKLEKYYGHKSHQETNPKDSPSQLNSSFDSKDTSNTKRDQLKQDQMNGQGKASQIQNADKKGKSNTDKIEKYYGMKSSSKKDEEKDLSSPFIRRKKATDLQIKAPSSFGSDQNKKQHAFSEQEYQKKKEKNVEMEADWSANKKSSPELEFQNSNTKKRLNELSQESESNKKDTLVNYGQIAAEFADLIDSPLADTSVDIQEIKEQVLVLISDFNDKYLRSQLSEQELISYYFESLSNIVEIKCHLELEGDVLYNNLDPSLSYFETELYQGKLLFQLSSSETELIEFIESSFSALHGTVYTLHQRLYHKEVI